MLTHDGYEQDYHPINILRVLSVVDRVFQRKKEEKRSMHPAWSPVKTDRRQIQRSQPNQDRSVKFHHQARSSISATARQI